MSLFTDAERAEFEAHIAENAALPDSDVIARSGAAISALMGVICDLGLDEKPGKHKDDIDYATDVLRIHNDRMLVAMRKRKAANG